MRLMQAVLMTGLLAGVCWSPGVLAQQGEEPTAPPATGDSTDDKEKKIPFALYVYASTGTLATDSINTSIETDNASFANTFVTFDDQDYTKAMLGWKLPHGKGDFRLSFNGLRENGYDVSAVGSTTTVTGAGGAIIITDSVPWWSISVNNGMLVATQAEPMWDAGDDIAGNDNGAVDFEEIRYAACPMTQVRTRAEVVQCFEDTLLTAPLFANTIGVTDDLQNTALHVDLLYGREFGRRRYSARWWTGLRYFAYEGNLLASAWLGVGTGATGFTDGTNLRLLNFAQETSGFGPTGAMEADFNFFDKRVQLYFGGQVAFVVLDLETHTGTFFSVVADGVPPVFTPAAASLQQDRTKSAWQTGAEAGARFKLKSGLSFELAYNITGYLDVILTPPVIQIPQTLNEAQQGTSAVYNTQDLVSDGWRVGVSFQF